MTTRAHLTFSTAFVALALTGCFASTSPSGLTAINLRTGETRSFETEEDVPEGWAVCADDGTCPEPVDCTELDEASCIVRSDCDPVYAEGAPDDADPYVSCGHVTVDDCTPEECDPAPGASDVYCDDGTILPIRCLRRATGICGWEIPECPAPTECAEEECGPAPGAPAYLCEDGSIGGNTGRCLRNPDGVCGWEFRDCPPVSECTVEECGPAPGADPSCGDGSSAAATCERAPDGTCGWSFRCGGCATVDCGPAPGGAEPRCADGSAADLVCRSDSATGVCGWEFLCAGTP